jgi:hypothetical protein
LAVLAVGLAAARLSGHLGSRWADLFIIGGPPAAALPMLMGEQRDARRGHHVDHAFH